MTETWAPLLEVTAMMVEDDSPDRAAKLRRLASLLEQITPEMVRSIRLLAHAMDGTAHPNHITRMRSAADMLLTLSTAPTEETEDR